MKSCSFLNKIKSSFINNSVFISLILFSILFIFSIKNTFNINLSKIDYCWLAHFILSSLAAFALSFIAIKARLNGNKIKSNCVFCFVIILVLTIISPFLTCIPDAFFETKYCLLTPKSYLEEFIKTLCVLGIFAISTSDVINNKLECIFNKFFVNKTDENEPKTEENAQEASENSLENQQQKDNTCVTIKAHSIHITNIVYKDIDVPIKEQSQP